MFKFRKPGRCKAGLPDIQLSQKTVKSLNDLYKNLPKRSEEGLTLMLLEQANVLKKELEITAPVIDTAGGEYDYSSDLRVGVVSSRDEPTVAIWLESRVSALDESQMGSTLLSFFPYEKSPPYVAVLARYSPWPATLVPKLKKSEAKAVAKSARPDEFQRRMDQFAQRKSQIERELKDAGAPDPEVELGSRASGMSVVDDLASAILRSEFGWGKGKKKVHWRPAIQVMLDNQPKVMKKYMDYLRSGDDSKFDLPDEDRVRWEKLRKGMAFQRVLAPFVK